MLSAISSSTVSESPVPTSFSLSDNGSASRLYGLTFSSFLRASVSTFGSSASASSSPGSFSSSKNSPSSSCKASCIGTLSPIVPKSKPSSPCSSAASSAGVSAASTATATASSSAGTSSSCSGGTSGAFIIARKASICLSARTFGRRRLRLLSKESIACCIWPSFV